jgi:hypothetical protein
VVVRLKYHSSRRWYSDGFCCAREGAEHSQTAAASLPCGQPVARD